MNRTSPKSVVLGLLCAAFALGCVKYNPNRVKGSGVPKTEQRQVGDFDTITLAGSAQVNVTVGPEVLVTVEADDNVVPVIETKVKGDTLVISHTEQYDSKVGVKVTITTPRLKGVALAGSGDINVNGISGDDFSASITGSGDITAVGATKRLDATITGSGDLKLAELQADAAKVTVVGSGDATVSASDELSVSIAGSGDVRYIGSPAKIDKSVAGSGSVRQGG
jgi:hypothetical protein